MVHRTFSTGLRIGVACLFALLVTRPAIAQDGGGHAGGAGAEDIGKKMSEISRLMRESERLLLEMTKIEQIVAQQRRVVEQLEKLKTPKQDDPAGGTNAGQKQAEKQKQEQQQAAEKKQREQLQQKQAELRRKLENLFKNQDRASSGSVTALEELLRSLPSGGGQGGGSGPPQSQQSGGEKKKKKGDEKKQNDKKDKKDKNKQDKPRDGETRDEKREEREREKQSQIDRIEAWIARLPRIQLEAINRNDFSSFPPRYRRLLREYTRRRAKREAEDNRDD